MAEKRLKANVLVATPPGSDQASAVFGPDSTEIPDWALEQLGDHVWEDGDSAPAETPDDGDAAPAKKTAAKRSSPKK